MSGTPVTTTPAVTEEDRAKAVALLSGPHGYQDRNHIESVAAALAAERGKADALRAAMHALAEELETESIRYIRAADGEPADSLMRKYVTGRVTSLQQSAARLRAAVESFGGQQ